MKENMQRPQAAFYDPSGALQIHSFFLTIQGEGPFCGERAIFFRLHGCNLRCPGCDTEYTGTNTSVAHTYLVNKARRFAWPAGTLVVITGGEPFRQNIGPAVEALLEAGYRVQVETNGVLCPDGLPWGNPLFSVVCSPKTKSIHPVVHQNAKAFKYVLRHGEIADDGLPTRALMHPSAQNVARPPAGALVFVQPMDEDDRAANALNLSAAVRSSLDFGYRLQLQIHKICNLP